MKPKTIIADPLALDRAGIQSLRMAASFIHLGRCGLRGTTIPNMARDLKLNPSTVNVHVSALRELHLVTEFSRANARGKARHYCVTVRGWELLTRSPDYSMFEQSDAVVK